MTSGRERRIRAYELAQAIAAANFADCTDEEQLEVIESILAFADAERREGAREALLDAKSRALHEVSWSSRVSPKTTTEYYRALCALAFWRGEVEGRETPVFQHADGRWEAVARHAKSEMNSILRNWGDGFFHEKAQTALSEEKAVVTLVKKIAGTRKKTYEYMGPRMHKLPYWRPAWMGEG